MKFTKDELRILSAWEDNFNTAVNADWARNPGRTGLKTIWEIYTRATGDQERYNDNCSHCILRLLKAAGRVYFADKAELAKLEAEARKVEDKPVKVLEVKHVSVKTKKRTTKTQK